MPIPPQFLRNSPGRQAAGAPEQSDEPADVGDEEVKKALDVLERKIDSPRGQAALKTIRQEIEEGSENDPRPDRDMESPGMKAAALFGK